MKGHAMFHGLGKARRSLGMGWGDAERAKLEQDHADMLAEMEQAGWLVIRDVGDVYSPTDRRRSLCMERTENGFDLYGATAAHLSDDQAFALMEWIAARFGMEVMRDVVPNAETKRRMIALVEKATLGS